MTQDEIERATLKEIQEQLFLVNRLGLKYATNTREGRQGNGSIDNGGVKKARANAVREVREAITNKV